LLAGAFPFYATVTCRRDYAAGGPRQGGLQARARTHCPSALLMPHYRKQRSD